jgi:hypothetical protein
VIDRLALCRLISENTTVVSKSYPHASQDHKLPTHRSLTYLESLTAIEAAWQLGQRWCAFSLIRFTSICLTKTFHRTCERWRACPVCRDRARDAKLAERNRQLTSRFGRSYSRSGCDKRPNRYRAQPHAVRHNVAVILMARMTCALWLIMISCSPQE